jgi:amino-acid N-acetyltransferase
MIRRATIHDVPAMARIINNCAEYGLMLHRSHSYLYERLRDFHVAVEDDRVMGVCGLCIVWANLAEVYALAIVPEARGRGLGRSLAEAAVAEARRLGLRKVFALTYEQTFFAKLGFEIVDRQQLPLKVWNECVRCLKNQSCDEIAMVRVLQDVPEVEAPQPEQAPSNAYIVPVTISLGGKDKRQKMSEGPSIG